MIVPEAVRRVVRERAGERCEYCREPEVIAKYSYHVDHIIGQKHGGSSSPDNLAWACPECNILKGSDIASIDWDTGALIPLFNPRTERWDDHFALAEAVIIGKTPIGRVTIHILQLNAPHRVELRTQLIEAGVW